MATREAEVLGRVCPGAWCGMAGVRRHCLGTKRHREQSWSGGMPGGQGVPASQLHIHVALNQEDKHRSVRLPLRGSGSLKPPQSERQVEKPRTGAQGHMSGLMGRAPPCPGGSAGHRLTSCSVMGADGGSGTESRGVNARLFPAVR